MDIRELKSRFIQVRNYPANGVNELMDFAKKAYVQNEISIKEYRLLVRDLEAQGAVSPNSTEIHLASEKPS
ncbi:YppF family protein [Bacillota bacterium Lsc_1132]